jgi:nucleotide-binding universal stress UspA family protein
MEETTMKKRVLIPVDGSPQSLAAVHAVVREGPAVVERIDLVNVQPLLSQHISRWVARDTRDAWRAERSSEALEGARALLDSSGIPWAAHATAGPVAESINGTARTLHSDEIVISAARRGPFAHAFANSVSTQLLESSRVPVRVIPAAEAPIFGRVALPAGLGIAALLYIAAD